MADPRNTRSRARDRCDLIPDPEELQGQIGAILARIHALESSSSTPVSSGGAQPGSQPASPCHVAAARAIAPSGHDAGAAPAPPPLESNASTAGDFTIDPTERLIGALSALTKMTGKLDSGMRGPYRVKKVLSHGRYELQLLGGSYGKTTQAAAEHMVAWQGEWTPESCATFFESMDEATTETTGLTGAGVSISPPAPENQPGPFENIENNNKLDRIRSPESPASSSRDKSPAQASLHQVQAHQSPTKGGRGQPHVRRGRVSRTPSARGRRYNLRPRPSPAESI